MRQLTDDQFRAVLERFANTEEPQRRAIVRALRQPFEEEGSRHKFWDELKNKAEASGEPSPNATALPAKPSIPGRKGRCREIKKLSSGVPYPMLLWRAEPSRAELRASAIRGQLRWWFRCLGGSREEESQVFGAVHLEDPKASTLAIRIAGAPIGGEADWYSHIPVNGMHPSTYLLGFFCGRTRRMAPGGAISPGSKTTVEVVFRRPPSPKLELSNT